MSFLKMPKERLIKSPTTKIKLIKSDICSDQPKHVVQKKDKTFIVVEQKNISTEKLEVEKKSKTLVFYKEIKEYIKEYGFIEIINILILFSSIFLIIKSYFSSDIKMLVIGCFLGILFSFATNNEEY